MRLPVARLLLLVCALLAVAPAAANAATPPKVTSVAPLKLKIGERLTIRGKGFLAGIFGASYGPAMAALADISTAEKRKLAAGTGVIAPSWPDSPWGRAAAAGWNGRCDIFTDFLRPVLRACAESVTHLAEPNITESASRLSDITFRTCLADREGPVDLLARGLAALWFERDLARLAGALPRDLESAETALAAVARRRTDPRAEANANAVVVRVLLEAGTLHRRCVGEAQRTVALWQSLAADLDGPAASDATAHDLQRLSDAASHLGLAAAKFGDRRTAADAWQLSRRVADQAAEDVDEMGLALEADGEGDAPDGVLWIQQQLLGGLDEGGDLLWGQGLAHARAPGMSSISAPPASLLSTFPPGTTRIVRPFEPPVAVATTGMRSLARPSRTAVALRTPMSRAADVLSENIWAPPTRAALSMGREVPSATTRSTSPMRCASAAGNWRAVKKSSFTPFGPTMSSRRLSASTG